LIFTILPSYWKLEITPSHTKIKQGITEEGHPWIGASNPEITIHEFTDYMCFQCYKMHFFLRNVLSEYPDKIRLVHHNFPLDHEVNPILVPKDFHVGSGKLALIAIKAIQLNKFWEMNDILYQAGRRQGNFNIAKLASEAGIKNSASTLAQYDDSNAYQTLEHDIREGLRNNITSTPSYIIKGVTYTGTLPVTLFQNLAAKPTRKP
jgi:protein-disulfide isomerase